MDGGNLLDALGDGFTLRAFDPAAEPFQQAAHLLRTPLRLVSDARSYKRKRYDAALVRVRPDQFAAWASDHAPADPGVVLQKVIGG